MTLLLRTLALSLITVPMSELWFYEVALSLESYLTIAFYMVSAALFVVPLAFFRDTGRAGAIVAAGFFGLATEGIPVPVLYEALPFTILWTSIAWHALISIGVGFIAMRILLQGSVLRAAAVFAVFGVLLGIWNGYSWTENGTAPAFDVFAWQCFVGLILFVAGHLLWDGLAGRDVKASKASLYISLLIAGVLFALSWFWVLFPLSLTLPLLLAIGFYLLSKTSGRDNWMAQMCATRIPPRRYGLFLVFFAGLLAGYPISSGQPWEINAYWILITGPISLSLWIGAHISLARRPR